MLWLRLMPPGPACRKHWPSIRSSNLSTASERRKAGGGYSGPYTRRLEATLSSESSKEAIMWVLQRAYQNIILDTATGIQKFWDGQIRPLPIIG